MNAEDTKGRVKEAAGDLTGNDELAAEGEADQKSASIKEKLSDAVDSVKDALTKD